MAQLIYRTHTVIRDAYRHYARLISFHSIMFTALFSVFVVGTSDADVLSDAGSKIDYVYGNTGDDVVVYTPSLNHAQQDHYDGGTGMDTLWLRMKKSEFHNPIFQADLILYFTFLIFHANPSDNTGVGKRFQFTAFDLSVRNLENLVVEELGEATPPAQPVPAGRMDLPDSSIDSLV